MAIRTGFGWKDMDVVILGNIPLHIQEIKYKMTHEKQNKMGRGDQPVSRHRGNKSYEVTLVLGMEECVNIEKALRAKYGRAFDPTDLKPFDIPITYDNGEYFVADVIKDFEFTEWGRGAAQGDMGIDQSVPGICSRIEFSVPL